MASRHQHIVDQFFSAVSMQDFPSIRKVTADDVNWYFMGQHPLAGVKKGIHEVVSFFSAMSALMHAGKPDIKKLIVCENENHLIECIHSVTHREDGLSLDHHACVLWTFANDKIVEGRHFFADPLAVDAYFNAVAEANMKS